MHNILMTDEPHNIIVLLTSGSILFFTSKCYPDLLVIHTHAYPILNKYVHS